MISTRRALESTTGLRSTWADMSNSSVWSEPAVQMMTKENRTTHIWKKAVGCTGLKLWPFTELLGSKHSWQSDECPPRQPRTHLHIVKQQEDACPPSMMLRRQQHNWWFKIRTCWSEICTTDLYLIKISNRPTLLHVSNYVLVMKAIQLMILRCNSIDLIGVTPEQP